MNQIVYIKNLGKDCNILLLLPDDANNYKKMFKYFYSISELSNLIVLKITNNNMIDNAINFVIKLGWIRCNIICYNTISLNFINYLIKQDNNILEIKKIYFLNPFLETDEDNNELISLNNFKNQFNIIDLKQLAPNNNLEKKIYVVNKKNHYSNFFVNFTGSYFYEYVDVGNNSFSYNLIKIFYDIIYDDYIKKLQTLKWCIEFINNKNN